MVERPTSYTTFPRACRPRPGLSAALARRLLLLCSRIRHAPGGSGWDCPPRDQSVLPILPGNTASAPAPDSPTRSLRTFHRERLNRRNIVGSGERKGLRGVGLPTVPFDMSPDADPIPALKREVAAALTEVVRHGNGDDLGALLGTDRFRISDLRHGRLARFSLETLLRLLARAGMRFELRIEPVSYRKRSTSRAIATDSHQSPFPEPAPRRPGV